MQTLRKLAADYMLNHQDDFLPFLTDVKTGQANTSGIEKKSGSNLFVYWLIVCLADTTRGFRA